MGMALMIGTIAFALFVWLPISKIGAAPDDWGLYRLLLVGWLVGGIASVLMLLMRASVFLDTSIPAAITHPLFFDFTLTSEFGRWWLLRMVLWAGIGFQLYRKSDRGHVLGVALVLAMGMLLTHSLYGHSTAAPDALAAVIATWLHLLLASIWVGGLLCFLIVLIYLRRANSAYIGRMVAYFSNYVRAAVIGLYITGMYTTWLLIGSADALFNTIYGQTLLVKLALFLPLLGLAAVNLLITQRKLDAGKAIWVGRLRGLVAAEIIFTIGIFAAVAVMTSAPPARSIQTQRNTIAAIEAIPMPQPENFFDMVLVDNRMVHLEISPAQTGENTFVVTPFDDSSSRVSDATLVRLRFDNLDMPLGESELVLAYDPWLDAYTADASNLSTTGTWRVRATIQRPAQFDTVADFEVTLDSPPAFSYPVINQIIPDLQRVLLSGMAGIALFGVGSYFISKQGATWRDGQPILGLLCFGTGILFLLTALSVLIGGNTLIVVDAWARPTGEGMPAAVYFTLENHTSQPETLVSAEVDFADDVEFHQTVIENDLARMIPIQNFVIPAGESLLVEPAGNHLMLINLHRTLEDGDSFP